MIGRTRIVPWGLAGFSVLVLISISGPVKAVDFLRGDANGDGVVSIADAHYVLNNLFRSGPALDCEDAGDANDSGALTIADTIGILNFLFLGGDPPAPPFPGAGADTTDDSLACQSYGGGSPLEDPAAKLELREVTAAGRHVFLTLALSSSASVGGYSARIFDQAGVIQDASAKVGIGSDLTGTLRDGFMGLSPDPARPQRFLAGVLIFMISDPFRAGRDVPVLGISVCLKPGTAPGEYPMILEAGELADFESGRAIHPTLVSGKIKVLSTLGDTTCRHGEIPRLNVLFKLEDTTGARGSEATVPFSIRADRASQAFSYSIDFDEAVLQAEPTQKVFQRPGGVPYEFETFEINNNNSTPGNGGVDEGYLAGAAIISLTDTSSVLPVDTEVKVLSFPFTVREDAPLGSTEIKFLDGAQGPTGPVTNGLIAGGMEVTPDLAGSFVFVNAHVMIVGDITLFIRGDSNQDGKVDVSDPVNTLGYLFLGAGKVTCPDAADANDDGTMDIGDAIMTLHHLFLGTRAPAPPFPEKGADATPDALGCN